jgi:putative transposase
MNPVRAGMVRHPAEYPWSSFRSNAMGVPSTFLNPHAVFRALGESEIDRRLAYRELFDVEETQAGLEEIRAAVRGGFALGSPEFVERVGRALGRRAGRVRNARPHRQGALSGLSPV